MINTLQEKINQICAKQYKTDGCPPKYTVSILYESEDVHKIILTINHSWNVLSTILFPQPDMLYGYENLEWEMKQLYNQTM